MSRIFDYSSPTLSLGNYFPEKDCLKRHAKGKSDTHFETEPGFEPVVACPGRATTDSCHCRSGYAVSRHHMRSKYDLPCRYAVRVRHIFPSTTFSSYLEALSFRETAKLPRDGSIWPSSSTPSEASAPFRRRTPTSAPHGWRLGLSERSVCRQFPRWKTMPEQARRREIGHAS